MTGEQPRWPVWVVLPAVALGAVLIGVLFALLDAVGLDAVTDESSPGWDLAFEVIAYGSFAVAAVAVARIAAKQVRAWHFGLRSASLGRCAWIVLAALVVLTAAEVIFSLLVEVDSNIEEYGVSGVAPALAISAGTIIVAPVGEELLFRGLFYGSVRRRLTVWPAALLNAAVFAPLHVSGWDDAPIVALLLVWGVGLCLVYEWTGTLFAPLALHVMSNTLVVLGTEAGYAVPLLLGAAATGACALAVRYLPPRPSPSASWA